MKKLVILFVILLGYTSSASAQEWVVKSNALYMATTTLNIGTEVALSDRYTLDLVGVYNPFNFKHNKKLKIWGLQPELRWWLCEKFDGHFFGVHAHYGQYNGGLSKYRYQGWLAGAGVSYGYQWILGYRWNLEAEVGFGYARMNHDRYLRLKCGKFIDHDTKNYFGPTKLGISFVYIIKQ